VSEKPDLRLDWCSHVAAKYATTHWHYSRSMPAGKCVKIEVRENGRFVGVVIFSLGSNRHLGREFGLGPFQCCELTRVALDRHETPVSRILAIALKMLKRQSPGLKAVVSYADCDQDHVGGIYQAGGWLFIGKVQLNGGTPKFRVRGRIMHGRSIHSRWGRGSQRIEWLREHLDPNAEKVFTKGKMKYVWPFDPAVRERVLPMTQPYPKRAGSRDNAAPDDQSGEDAVMRSRRSNFLGANGVGPSSR
jgi:hypothetical protein